MELLTMRMRHSAGGGLFSTRAAETARNIVSRWPSYAATPLLSLDQLAGELKLGEIFLKYEGCRFGIGSFKALGAAYALESFLTRQSSFSKRSHRSAALTVVCASDGNYGRAVAWAAQRLGCECVVYLPAHVTEFREKAIQQYGARTLRLRGNYDSAEAAAKCAVVENGWSLISDSSDDNYTVVPRDVMTGYCVMLSEIAEIVPLSSFTHVFLQCGVGAFAGAVCDYLYSALGSNTPSLVSVEPVSAACIFASAKQGRLSTVPGQLTTIMAGLACGRPSPLAWGLLRSRLSFCTTLDDSWAIEAVRLLASGRASGMQVVAGETGVAGLGALLCAANDSRWRHQLGLDCCSRVLLFCTEGATDPGIYERIVKQAATTPLDGPNAGCCVRYSDPAFRELQ